MVGSGRQTDFLRAPALRRGQVASRSRKRGTAESPLTRESARSSLPRRRFDILRPREEMNFPEEPNAGRAALATPRMDVQTDPEPGMDSGQATVRNVRSKCRCSCVLQFTFRRAVGCVLHRPPSQVIHCTVLCFKVILPWADEPRAEILKRQTHSFTSPHRERAPKKLWQGRGILRRLAISSLLLSEHRTTRPEPPAAQETLTVDPGPHAV